MNDQHDLFDVLINFGEVLLRVCVRMGNKEAAKEVWGRLKTTLENYS